MELAGKQGEIKIYTTPWCPYCISAKKLLDKKGVTYDDMDVSYEQDIRTELRKMTGSRTVPQIFINGQTIGGCDDLFALEKAGKLDKLLADVK